MKKVWTFLRDHWKLAAVAVIVIVALILGKRLVDLIPAWVRKVTGIGDVPDPQSFKVVDRGHVIAKGDKGWEVVDVGSSGIDANKVTAIHVDDARVVVGTRG